MRFRIKYDCEVAAILEDGTMTTVGYAADECIDPRTPACLPPSDYGIMHIDIDVDGMTLINVPVSLLDEEESVDAHCV